MKVSVFLNCEGKRRKVGMLDDEMGIRFQYTDDFVDARCRYRRWRCRSVPGFGRGTNALTTDCRVSSPTACLTGGEICCWIGSSKERGAG